MLLLKRILLTVMEAGVLTFGVTSTFALTWTWAAFVESKESIPDYTILFVFFGGLALTIFAFLLLQKKTRKWKLEYDAAKWLAGRAERKLHPARAKYRRTFGRYLLWLPSACAALVAFFFPITTHFVHPCSHYLKHYRVPIPWTWTVFSSLGAPAEYSYTNALITIGAMGRYGVTPFWKAQPLFSVATFGSVGPDGSFEFNETLREQLQNGAANLSRRDFQLGKTSLTCWKYIPANRSRVWNLAPNDSWEIDCSTPTSVHDRNFYAYFYGEKDHALLFYKVLEHITPVD
jgi:hypothetical protein